MHCKCVCETLNSPEKTSSFVGGEIKAYSRIETGNLGNEKHVYTKVYLCDKESEEIKKKNVKLAMLKKELMKRMEPLKKEIENKAKMVKNIRGRMSSSVGDNIKKTVDAYSDFNMKLKHVNNQIEINSNALKDTSRLSGFIKAGNVFPNVDVDLYGMKRFKVDMIKRDAVYKIDNGEVNTDNSLNNNKEKTEDGKD